MSAHMQRLLQSAGQDIKKAAPILELNAEHAILQKINREKDMQRVARWSHILLNQALLAEGEQLPDPANFVKELNQLLVDVQ